MQKKEYLLLDNAQHLNYLFSGLQDKYIFITTDAYVESYLKANNIPVIGIFEYLTSEDINAITKEASLFVDSLIFDLDRKNRKLFSQIFGRECISFFYSTMNYLFKRFVIGSFRIINGLEAISRHNNINNLDYLVDDHLIEICGNRKHKSFSFPSNAIWKLLLEWNSVNKPKISLLKTSQLSADSKGMSSNFILTDIIERMKRPLRKTRDLFRHLGERLPPYSLNKKNLLFLAPFYDFSFILHSDEIKDRYNLIIWNIDDIVKPGFLPKQPRDDFFCCKDANLVKTDLGITNYRQHFDLDSQLFKKSKHGSIKLGNFLTPLISSFIIKKLPDIINYWRAAENLHKVTKVDAFFWGNPPHRYPAGIVKEFFRLNKVPIFGMQHGGVYGSNDLGTAIFDLDLNHCDYYFSYGFDRHTFSAVYSEEKKIPQVIPVGSTVIASFIKRYNSPKHSRKKIKILYPIAVNFSNMFIAPEFTMPKLFNFQKKILDVLARFKDSGIVLKFPCGSYHKHWLRPYIEREYSGVFNIRDDISYQRSLELYDPENIIIEQQSTPLNESLVTRSNIIVYNDQMFIGLTQVAFSLLSKRAIICNGQEDFLQTLTRYMQGGVVLKDLGNREFLEKYCVYKGSPQENIIKAIGEYI